MEAWLIEAPTIPLKIHCHGPDGRGCPRRNAAPLATIENGLVVVRDGGRVHVNPLSTTCRRCGTVRTFRARDALINNAGAGL